MLESVPQELKVWPNWVGWKHETRGADKTKLPFDVRNGSYAKVNDLTTWTLFESAAAFAYKYEGLGIVLSGIHKEGLPLVGIDFDGVDGADPYLGSILQVLGTPYAEITPSGFGVRAFVYANLPPGGRRFTRKNPKFGAEIYSAAEPGRYLTVTGNGPARSIPVITDISLAYFLVSNILDDKFRRLWLGSLEEYDGDQSRADLALAGMLGRLLGGDWARAEEYFGYSALGSREKWKNREDYRRRTMAQAAKPFDSGVRFGSPNADILESQRALTSGELQTVKASDVRMKVLRWLWQDRIPYGKLTLLCGNPDNGKSLVTLDTAARLTTGTAFYGCKIPPEPASVLIFAGEDDLADTLVPRLRVAGADLARVMIVTVVKGDNPPRAARLDVDLAKIEAYLDGSPAVRLVVIDPVSNYLGGVQMNDEQSVREVLSPMVEMAERREIAVLLVLHMNKKSDLDMIHRVGGAMAFVGVPRMAWLFERKRPAEGEVPDDTVYMCKLKGNIVDSKRGGLTFRTIAKKIEIEGEESWIPTVEWTGTTQEDGNALLKPAKKRETRKGPPEVATDENFVL